MREVPGTTNDLGFGQILGPRDTFRRIRQILSGSRHGIALLGQVGGLKLAQDFAHGLEAANAPTQRGELHQRGVRAATAIEQTVDFLHDVPHRAQLR